MTELFNRIVEAFGTSNGAEIGRKLKVSKNLVYRWRDGDGIPTSETFLKIFECTGVSLHWLMVGDGAKNISAETVSMNSDKGEWTLFSSLVDGKLRLRLQRGDVEINYTIASITHDFDSRS